MDSDNESVDSDRELQIAFESGLLKPGLNIPVDERPKPVTNIAGLKACLEELKKELPWEERLEMCEEPTRAPQALDDMNISNGADDVHDDFKREMLFYCQAQAAVMAGIPRLRLAGIPTRRPEDYFAEMAKSDLHMKKVREKLLSKQIAIERSEKAKKMRELRKYGKKVQQEVLLKRQKEKKDMMDAVKKFRQGKNSRLDFLEEEKLARKPNNNNENKKTFQPGKKRKGKNDKFGYGGQKKRMKSNTADSAASMDDFSVKKHNSAPSKFKKKFVNKNRPGKSRRQKTKSKGR